MGRSAPMFAYLCRGFACGWSDLMKAFVIVAETIKDDAMFADYRAAVPATVETLRWKVHRAWRRFHDARRRVAASSFGHYRVPIPCRCVDGPA